MKLISLLFTLLLVTFSTPAQNLVGYSAEKIKKHIEKNNAELSQVTGLKNDKYDYLKYEDEEGDMTVMFFMSEDNKCTSVKSIYVHSLRDEVTAELDKSYTKRSENVWSDENKGKEAVITLEVEDWFFTVSIKPDKKE